MTLRIEFFSGEESPVAVVRTDGGVSIAVEAASYELSRTEAAALRTAIGDALARRCEFYRTAGEHRADGSYVVARMGADSTGNRQVFGSFAEVRALYDRLPARFDADRVGEEGFSGSRRHLLVRHFVEHPRFDCELVRERPLVAVKGEGTDGR